MGDRDITFEGFDGSSKVLSAATKTIDSIPRTVS